MNCSSRPLNAVNPLPTTRSAVVFWILSKIVNISLPVETSIVMILAIFVIRVFGTSSGAWFLTPAVLIAAALIPTAINKRKFAGIGFENKQIRNSLVLLMWACIITFPLMVCGLWLMKHWGLELPLRAVLPPAQGWFSWLFYQFMYVAVAEEVFFRGYVLNNILRLTGPIQQEQIAGLGLPHHNQTGGLKPTLHSKQNDGLKPTLLSVIISAAIFAIAHTIVRCELYSVLTFLPGLVLGWLFVRTRSLLAPILFHGLANVAYLCAAAALV